MGGLAEERRPAAAVAVQGCGRSRLLRDDAQLDRQGQLEEDPLGGLLGVFPTDAWLARHGWATDGRCPECGGLDGIVHAFAGCPAGDPDGMPEEECLNLWDRAVGRTMGKVGPVDAGDRCDVRNRFRSKRPCWEPMPLPKSMDKLGFPAGTLIETLCLRAP